jgi:hypothetical protein
VTGGMGRLRNPRVPENCTLGHPRTEAQSPLVPPVPALPRVIRSVSEERMGGTVLSSAAPAPVLATAEREQLEDRSFNLGAAHIRLTREDFYGLQLWLREHGVLVPNPLSLRRR